MARAGDAARRAVIIAVPSFATPDDGDEPGLSSWAALPFAPDLGRQVAEALETCGYESTVVSDPNALGAADLGRTVTSLLHRCGPSDVAVVHVVSHGEINDRTQQLFAVGADGATSAETDIDQWLKIIEAFPDQRPLTLFLLDLCHGGAAARLPWQLRTADGSARAWVLAASEPDRSAFDGRFSRAVATVLGDVAEGRLGIDDSIEYVPLDTVARAVRREVVRLSAGASRQQVTNSLVDIGAEPDWRFFPNPRHREANSGRKRALVEPALSAFADQIDEGIDAAHFALRAMAAGQIDAPTQFGFFRGRARELTALSEWVDGGGAPGVRVVTGNPGAGKSALLGVLVCAAHPVLREVTSQYWQHLPSVPGANPGLVAVHARQRTLEEIVSSMARQIHLKGTTEALSASALIDFIVELEHPPVIILDALDEADRPGEVVSLLLRPLIVARRADGEALCRLIVGTRTGAVWPQLEPLRAVLGERGLVDLDRVPREQLAEDLCQYVDDLLRSRSPYDRADLGATRRRIALATASALTEEAAASRQWGEFLVAGLFAHHLLSIPPPAADSLAIDALIERVPRTLPEVLEMDLAAHGHNSWVRPILTALAYGQGDGLPSLLLHAVAPAFAGSGEADHPHAAELTAALASVRFYLRRSVDVDGTTLYRLFHQGLADYLWTASFGESSAEAAAGVVLDRLLAGITDEIGARRWDLAEPYLLRHAVKHADLAGRTDDLLTDAGFLVHGDPGALSPYLGKAHTKPAMRAAAAYRASAHLHRNATPNDRRQMLSIDAARVGAESLVAALCSSPHQSVWQPTWATGSQVSLALRATMTGHTQSVLAVACTVLDKRPVAVTGGSDFTVRIWDLGTGEPIGGPLVGHEGEVAAVACTILAGRPIAVTGGGDETVRVWDLGTAEPVWPPLTGHLLAVDAVACTVIDNRPIAVTGGRDHTVRRWDLTTGKRSGTPLTGHNREVATLACTVINGRPVAVTGSGFDETLRVWDLRSGALLRDPITDSVGGYDAVACTVLDGVPIAVTGGELGRQVWVWNLETGEPHGAPLPVGTVGTKAVACTVVDKRQVAVTGSSDGSVRRWDLARRNQIGTPFTGHTSGVDAVACTVVDEHPVAVTGSRDGTVRVWDLAGGEPDGAPRTGHTGAVEALALTTVDGRPAIVTGGADGWVRAWNLGSGEPVGQVQSDRWVTALACAVLDERPVALTVGSDHRVRVWDLGTRAPVRNLEADRDHEVEAIACAVVEERPVVVTGGGDRTVRTWDIGSGAPLGAPLLGHTGAVTAVACTVVDGRAVVVSASKDGTLRRWDLRTGAPHETPLADPTNEMHHVDALACAMVDGRPLAVAGGSYGVWVWDLASGELLGELVTDEDDRIDTLACGVVHGRPVVVTGGGPTVGVWDLSNRRLFDSLRMPGDVSKVAVADSGDLVVAFGWDVVVLRAPLGSRR